MDQRMWLVGLVVAAILCASNCCGSSMEPAKLMDSTTMPTFTNNATVDLSQLNQTEIMLQCNETFHTSMDYLVELNQTGSFPDETDKTPMCYIKCYLEKVGILLADANLNRDRAIEMQWSTSDDSLDDCVKESRIQTNPCERAYYLTRCIMMRNLVDSRKTEV